MSAGDSINEVRIGVQSAAGANDINLAELTVQYVSDDEFANIMIGNDSNTRQATGDSDPSSTEVTNASEDGDAPVEYAIDVITAENETVRTERPTRRYVFTHPPQT